MLKILQARLQQYVNHELPDVHVKYLLAMQETQVQSLGWEDPLKEEMVMHSSTLAWRIPRSEEPGGL